MTEPQLAHSPFAASASARLLACPGSFALTAQVAASRDDATTSVYAAEGTVAHRLIEDWFQSARMPEARVGEVHHHAGHDIEITDEMARAVRVFLDEAERATRDAAICWSEKRVSLDRLWPEGAPLPMFGTADLLAVKWKPDGAIRLLDYKHGAGVPVEVRDNPQLLYYALAAILDLGLLDATEHGPGVGLDALVDIAIVQPRARHAEGPVRRAHYTVLDVLTWGHEVLKPGVQAALRPGAPLNPGPHCRFCPAAAVCPALRRSVLAVAQTEFSDSSSSPATLSDADLGALLDKIEMLEPWFKAVQQEARERAMAGANIPGWKLVLKPGRRRWLDEAQVCMALRDAGVPPASFLQPGSLRTPAQVAKTVPADVWALVAEYVGTTESLALVRAADARSVLRADPRADFEVVQPEAGESNG